MMPRHTLAWSQPESPLLMTAYAPPQSSPAPAQANPAVWQRVLDFVVRRRIAISLVAFIALIIEDVLTGVRPHDLTNLSDWHTAVGLTLVGAGLAIRSWAGGTLTKWGELTVSGPYGIIRHPLYVGSFLMMIGFCLIIDDSENLCFVLGPLLVLYLVHVGQEERRLSHYYGAKWDAYVAAVPRYLPRRLPKLPLANWSGRQWMNNREYQAVAGCMLGLALIQLWRIA